MVVVFSLFIVKKHVLNVLLFELCSTLWSPRPADAGVPPSSREYLARVELLLRPSVVSERSLINVRRRRKTPCPPERKQKKKEKKTFMFLYSFFTEGRTKMFFVTRVLFQETPSEIYVFNQDLKFLEKGEGKLKYVRVLFFFGTLI